MMISQKSKVKNVIASQVKPGEAIPSKIEIASSSRHWAGLLAMTFFALFTLHSTVLAITPTTTPIASPSATAVPSGSEEEKVQEIRDAIKEKVNEIKDKIEKKAYVGIISQITDSTFTLNNFRGKQRVRITEATTIIGANKKEIKISDLAVDDKVISLGTVSENEILEAKRVIVVPKPAAVPAKRLTFFGIIDQIDIKKSVVSINDLTNLDKAIDFKIDKTSSLILQSDLQAKLTLKDLKESQKVIIVYLETAQVNNPIVKSLFLLL